MQFQKKTFSTLPFVLKQGDDVALPEVPTEPIPEVPEAAKAEPGTADALILHHDPFIWCQDWSYLLYFLF